MKKSDLKTGHVVELRSGQRGLVVKDNCYNEDGIIFSNNDWTNLDDYSDALIWYEHESDRSDFTMSCDIVKVYQPSTPNNFLNYQSLKDHLLGKMKLVWERKENTTFTKVERFPNKIVTTVTTTVYN